MPINIPYLIKTLNTTKISELISVIDTPPIDFNLAIWDSIEKGEIEVDEKKDHVKRLTDDIHPWHDPDLAAKIISVVQHYAKNETNVTRGRLNGYMKEPVTNKGYPTHEYLMTLEYLLDTFVLTQEEIAVPKTKTRPYNKFAFICLPENAEKNQEWNAKAVNKWIAQTESAGVK